MSLNLSRSISDRERLTNWMLEASTLWRANVFRFPLPHSTKHQCSPAYVPKVAAVVTVFGLRLRIC